MTNIKEIDGVLKSVKQAAAQFGCRSDGAIGQQILLLGDSFYGYRFTSREFTAVWSAADQVLKLFDVNGKNIGSSILVAPVESVIDYGSSLRLPAMASSRKAA
ncbi:MAG: hypothetical protein ACRCUY_05220 [Thermoguttaceae bacterium]